MICLYKSLLIRGIIMEIWILIAVICVGLFLMISCLKHISEQLANLQAQIIQFQHQINNLANEKLQSSKPSNHRDLKLDSIESAVSELRDHLVPPKPGTLRAEMKEVEDYVKSMGID